MPGTKRTLYFITGLVSLVNALAVWSENSAGREAVFLIANKSVRDKNFFEMHRKIIKLFGLEHIYASDDFSLRTLRPDFPPESFDEVYTISLSIAPPETLELFSKAKIFWLDEGLSSYMDYFSQASHISAARFPVYNGKFDFMGAPDLPIIPIAKESILRVAATIAAAYPLDYPFGADDKVIIFLGQYLFEPLGEKALIDMHISALKRIVSAGYKVFLKPHPRILTSFAQQAASHFQSDNVYISNSRMPMELYNTTAVALVSFSSGSLVSMSHVHGLPAFYIPCDSEYVEATPMIGCFENLRYTMIKEYVPTIDTMLALENSPNSRPEALKAALWNIFEQKTQEAPLLSQNKLLNEEMDKSIDVFLLTRIPDLSKSLTSLRLEYLRCLILQTISSGGRKEHYAQKCLKIRKGIHAKRLGLSSDEIKRLAFGQRGF